MKKEDAVKEFVSRDFAGIPLDWVQAVAASKGEEIYAWPMWGTMWIVDSHIGERLMAHSRRMFGDADELRDNLDSIEDEREREEVKTALDDLKNESVAWGGVALLEDYISEEMAGAQNIKGTAAYIYEIDGRYVVGVHGAGWSFYDGVWDRLYDIMGLQWHEQNGV